MSLPMSLPSFVFTIQSSPPFMMEIIIVLLLVLFLAFPCNIMADYRYLFEAPNPDEDVNTDQDDITQVCAVRGPNCPGLPRNIRSAERAQAAATPCPFSQLCIDGGRGRCKSRRAATADGEDDRNKDQDDITQVCAVRGPNSPGLPRNIQAEERAQTAATPCPFSQLCIDGGRGRCKSWRAATADGEDDRNKGSGTHLPPEQQGSRDISDERKNKKTFSKSTSNSFNRKTNCNSSCSSIPENAGNRTMLRSETNQVPTCPARTQGRVHGTGSLAKCHQKNPKREEGPAATASASRETHMECTRATCPSLVQLPASSMTSPVTPRPSQCPVAGRPCEQKYNIDGTQIETPTITPRPSQCPVAERPCEQSRSLGDTQMEKPKVKFQLSQCSVTGKPREESHSADGSETGTPTITPKSSEDSIEAIPCDQKYNIGGNKTGILTITPRPFQCPVAGNPCDQKYDIDGTQIETHTITPRPSQCPVAGRPCEQRRSLRDTQMEKPKVTFQLSQCSGTGKPREESHSAEGSETGTPTITPKSSEDPIEAIPCDQKYNIDGNKIEILTITPRPFQCPVAGNPCDQKYDIDGTQIETLTIPPRPSQCPVAERPCEKRRSLGDTQVEKPKVTFRLSQCSVTGRPGEKPHNTDGTETGTPTITPTSSQCPIAGRPCEQKFNIDGAEIGTLTITPRPSQCPVAGEPCEQKFNLDGTQIETLTITPRPSQCNIVERPCEKRRSLGDTQTRTRSSQCPVLGKACEQIANDTRGKECIKSCLRTATTATEDAYTSVTKTLRCAVTQVYSKEIVKLDYMKGEQPRNTCKPCPAKDFNVVCGNTKGARPAFTCKRSSSTEIKNPSDKRFKLDKMDEKRSIRPTCTRQNCYMFGLDSDSFKELESALTNKLSPLPGVNNRSKSRLILEGKKEMLSDNSSTLSSTRNTNVSARPRMSDEKNGVGVDDIINELTTNPIPVRSVDKIGNAGITGQLKEIICVPSQTEGASYDTRKNSNHREFISVVANDRLQLSSRNEMGSHFRERDSVRKNLRPPSPKRGDSKTNVRSHSCGTQRVKTQNNITGTNTQCCKKFPKQTIDFDYKTLPVQLQQSRMAECGASSNILLSIPHVFPLKSVVHQISETISRIFRRKRSVTLLSSEMSSATPCHMNNSPPGYNNQTDKELYKAQKGCTVKAGRPNYHNICNAGHVGPKKDGRVAISNCKQSNCPNHWNCGCNPNKYTLDASQPTSNANATKSKAYCKGRGQGQGYNEITKTPRYDVENKQSVTRMLDAEDTLLGRFSEEERDILMKENRKLVEEITARSRAARHEVYKRYKMTKGDNIHHCNCESRNKRRN